MSSVKNLITEITNYLEYNKEEIQHIEILNTLKNISLDSKNFIYQKPLQAPKENALLKSLDSIMDQSLLPIKNAILLSLKELNWKIDNGLFYHKESNIGNDYLNGNMHTELIGPVNGFYKYNDFRLGLFLLEPHILYKDHRHEAPELYVNLTKNTSWRFNFSKWIIKDAGSIIYNEPFKVHGMKVSDVPFLSIWCWPNNSSKKCEIVTSI